VNQKLESEIKYWLYQNNTLRFYNPLEIMIYLKIGIIFVLKNNKMLFNNYFIFIFTHQLLVLFSMRLIFFKYNKDFKIGFH